MTNLKVLLAVCVLALLAACHRDSSQPAEAKPAAKPRAPVAAQRGPSPEEITKGMVEAASQGKSRLPVALKFDLPQRPTVGQPLEIAIAVIPQIPASPATIDVSASEGLKIADGSSRLEIPSVEPARVYRRAIKVTPTSEGVLFVSLTVNLTHDETTDSRAFSVPIIAAAPAAGAQTPVR